MTLKHTINKVYVVSTLTKFFVCLSYQLPRGVLNPSCQYEFICLFSSLLLLGTYNYDGYSFLMGRSYHCELFLLIHRDALCLSQSRKTSNSSSCEALISLAGIQGLGGNSQHLCHSQGVPKVLSYWQRFLFTFPDLSNISNCGWNPCNNISYIKNHHFLDFPPILFPSSMPLFLFKAVKRACYNLEVIFLQARSPVMMWQYILML